MYTINSFHDVGSDTVATWYLHKSGWKAIHNQHVEESENFHCKYEEDSNLCLVDGGANSGLTGAGMREYEMSESPERVDIIGASDDVENGMNGLPIGTYCGVVTSSKGVRCLGLFHNYVGYGKGKSILSVNQSLAFGVRCFPEPRKYGGEQKIVTNDAYVFKLKYKSGLSYLPIEYPSDDDMHNLPHINFSSPEPWNSEEECDDDDNDTWFECTDDGDDEELDDDECLDSRDGWIVPEDKFDNCQ